MAELTGDALLLERALPVLEQKEKSGLIKSRSHETGKSLVEWKAAGREWTDKQKALVAVLLNRANRRHRGGAPITVNTVQNLDVDAVARQVAGMLAEAAVDTDAVVEAVTARMLARTPQTVVVEVRRPTQSANKSTKVKGPTHAQFQHLVRAAAMRLPTGLVPGIFLQGEASSGKTTGARMLAEALSLPWHFNGAISMPHEMLGFIDGAGKYHRTPFRDAYEKGGVYTFDEVDRSDPNALLAVNPHLANGVATFPDRQVKRHEDCIIVCTANTWGLGADANYSGATKLDAAFLSRFPVRICWDIDPELESTIVSNPAWLARVRAARQRARAAGLKVLIDTRAAQAGAALIAAGYDADAAAGMTYLANLKPEQRRQVEGQL